MKRNVSDPILSWQFLHGISHERVSVLRMTYQASQTDRMPPEWLGLRQARCYASVSERTVRSWIHSPADPLPAVQVRGKILIRRSELEAWLERHRIQPFAAVDVDAVVRSVLGGRNGR